MCNLSQGVLAEGRAEGLVEGRVEMASSIIINMMKATNKTVSEAMDMLGIDEALRPDIMRMIESMNESSR